VQEAPVLPRRVQVIDQQPHPHTAVRRESYMMQQGPRGLILVNDVVLNVQRPLGMIGERDEARQRLITRGQEPDAGKILADLLLADDAAQRGGLRLLKGDRRRFLDMPRQAGAAGEH
jgi:hypothetical protein